MESKKQIYFFKGSNNEVIDHYFFIVEQALKRIGFNVVYIEAFDELKSLNKKSFVFVAELRHSIPLILKGFHNIIYWNQGTTPDEDYMRRKSLIRKLILQLCEYMTFKRSIYLLFVSEYMRGYYAKKYKISFDNTSHIMPCFNTNLKEECFAADKYKKNIFCYIGSLAKWQCFEETLDAYKKIETNLDHDCELRVFTGQGAEAKKLIESRGITNYTIKYVEPAHLHEHLKECKYGFLIREDNPVNHVATPTKMSTYLSCGIIPIYSDCIKDFSKLFSSKKYFVQIPCATKNLRFNSLLMLDKVDATDVYEEYKEIFDTYYNTESHISKLSATLATILN